jgi:Neuraminidase (sialidase)
MTSLKRIFIALSIILMLGMSFLSHAATLNNNSLNPTSVTQNTSDNRQAFWPFTGVMMRVNGELYLGEYSSQGKDGVIDKDATWAVKSNGSMIVIGHGSGRLYR